MPRLTWLAAGIAALCPNAATADALHATRGQGLFEVSHNVDIRIEDGVATYKVRRQFANPGKVSDEAGLAIDLPYGAAATGLRIRARNVWYDGELMEAEKAAALYHELTGLGAYRPKDPALLQWQWADKLYLQVFPVLPGQVSTVEYTLTVPTRYTNGHYFVSYPRVSAEHSEGTDRDGQTLKLATPVVTVHAAWANAATPILIDGQRIAADTPVVLTPPERAAWADHVAFDERASYVASEIEIPKSSHTDKVFATAKLTLDIRHTYKSDLRVELLTPAGESVMIHDSEGGDANDIIGTRDVKLPANTRGAGTWRLVVSDHAALDTGTLDRWEIVLGDTQVASKDTPIFIPDAPETGSDAGVASISIAPPAIPTWTARLGQVVASKKHAFCRLEIDVAPQLVPMPKQAQVVFVVDASYSVGEAKLAAELDIIRAYVTHLSDAQVEVVVYRRRAERLFGKMVAARDVDAALAKAKIALGNGSALDAGARLAAEVLAHRTGPRRVVLLTDELLRPSLSDPAALAALHEMPGDAVVHVVIPSVDNDDRSALERDDKHRLAPLATRHHGILVRINGLPTKTLKDLAPVVLELVRPTRIDDLKVTGIKIEEAMLHEGDGVRAMHLDETAPSRIVLTGKLWSDPIRKEVVAGDAFSRQTAAFVFGADEHHELSHDEQLRVAMMGRAVSPVTSYVAFEPGTRPSTDGFDDRGTFGGLLGSGAGELGGGFGFGRNATRLPFEKLVDVAHCVTAVHPKASWSVDFTVETTKDEIVDVAAKDTNAMAVCLVESVWNVRLDASYMLDHETHAFTLRGPAAP